MANYEDQEQAEVVAMGGEEEAKAFTAFEEMRQQPDGDIVWCQTRMFLRRMYPDLCPETTVDRYQGTAGTSLRRQKEEAKEIAAALEHELENRIEWEIRLMAEIIEGQSKDGDNLPPLPPRAPRLSNPLHWTNIGCAMTETPREAKQKLNAIGAVKREPTGTKVRVDLDIVAVTFGAAVAKKIETFTPAHRKKTVQVGRKSV